MNSSQRQFSIGSSSNYTTSPKISSLPPPRKRNLTTTPHPQPSFNVKTQEDDVWFSLFFSLWLHPVLSTSYIKLFVCIWDGLPTKQKNATQLNNYSKKNFMRTKLNNKKSKNKFCPSVNLTF
jgi:hypothetical protein